MNIKRFTELEALKKARQLRKAISELVKSFPTEEKYSLVSQIKRSSRSVTANIAEGYGRFHYQENIQFCRVSRGSLTETLDHLIVAFDEGYINETTLNEFQAKLDECLKILNGYVNYLQKAKERPDNQ
ncbi:MAG: four helix bundle protein [Roseivirga sp.]|nr:four helix bundle protein [Roseivirga sp.]